MLFLIEYDRPARRTVTYKTFPSTERKRAFDEHLQIELDLNRRGLLMQHEVVLLDALNEEDLRRTHGHYLENMPDPAEPVLASTAKSQS
jgi:hypothetical protein